MSTHYGVVRRTHTFRLSLSDEETELLRAIAFSTNRTMSGVLRDALRAEAERVPRRSGTDQGRLAFNKEDY